MGNGEAKVTCPGGGFEDLTFQLTESAPPRDFYKELETNKKRCTGTVESQADRTKRYLEYLTVSPEHLKTMMESFLDELERGLEMHKHHPYDWKPDQSSFKMLDACVQNMPKGDEKEVVYALDFGGSNFRALRIDMQGNGKVEGDQYKCNLSAADSVHPKGLMDGEATATQMFDFFASTVKFFMNQHGDISAGKKFKAGFTFSFPCVQREIDSAVLVCWTKGFETGRATKDQVENQDVGQLLKAAFDRTETPCTVSAILNDTVGTMLAGAYEVDRSKHPECLVGVILGTGTNACYVDDKASIYGYKGSIINIESGNFNRSLPQSNIDLEVDFAAVSNRGYQVFEKMYAGAYLGEIARRTLLKIFQGDAPWAAWQPHSLTAEDIGLVINDTSSNFIVTQKLMKDKWSIDMTQDQLAIVYQISRQVYDRAAACAAVLVASCAQKTGRLQPAMGGVTVAIDGSLYKCNSWYQERLRHWLEAILGKDTADLIHCVIAEDGSGKGAAILAATV